MKKAREDQVKKIRTSDGVRVCDWGPFFITMLMCRGHASVEFPVVACLGDRDLNVMADRLQMMPLLGGDPMKATDHANEYRETVEAAR